MTFLRSFPMFRRVSVFLVAIFIAVSLSAQDAADVLQANVAFTTMKNSISMTAEQRSEIDRLTKMAQQANGEGHYGQAIEDIDRGMAVLRGKEWTPTLALASALTVDLDRHMLDAPFSVRVAIGELFSPDAKGDAKISATLSLLRPTGDEPLKRLKTWGPDDNPPFTIPSTYTVTLSDVPNGKYRIALSLRIVEDGTPGAVEPAPFAVKATPLRIVKGMETRVGTLKARSKSLTARLAKSGQDLSAAFPTLDYDISVYSLANEGKVNLDGVDAALDDAAGILDSLEKGRDPFVTRRGDMKRAYRSDVDQTLQPYRLFIPSSYNATKTYPLIVALHGMGGDENTYFDFYGNGAFKVEAERRGYIVACPKGRHPASMYAGAAEKDVLDVIADVRRAYRVDGERLYLTGHSMGGYGTWSVAMAHPELFAALAPVAGGGDVSAMTKIASIPELVVHGDSDKTVSVEQSRKMVAAAKAAGVEVKYMEIVGGDHLSVALRTFNDVFDWFDTHKRQVATQKAPSAQ